mgnify:CR=1 FL=1
MTEHEQLKIICDKIWYKIEWQWYFDFDLWFTIISRWFDKPLDVREIIFTQEFMEKYISYTFSKCSKYDITYVWYWLLNNLNNPVEHLYNLIK